MALPVYDATKHHIGLGETGAVKGFLLDGTLTEQFQRPGAPAEFGSEDDVLAAVPSLSRWTQDDYSGGAYQRRWGADPAQFSRAKGFVPTQLGKTARTVAPLVPAASHQLGLGDLGDDSNNIALFVIGKYAIGVCFQDTVGQGSLPDRGKIFRVDLNTGEVADFATAGGDIFAASYHGGGSQSAGQVIYVRENGANYTVYLYDPFTGSLTAIGSRATSVGVPQGISALGNWIAVQFADNLYRGTRTGASTMTWTKVGRLPGRWQDSVTYNGWVYILLGRSRNNLTQVVAFDGTNILPITEFPYNFTGRCISSYAGRLYIGGHGNDFAGEDAYAELYEINGGTLRLIKTFRPESEIAGEDAPRAIYDLTVHDGLLYGAIDGPSLLTYDAITDSLWDGPEAPMNRIQNWTFERDTDGWVFSGCAASLGADYAEMVSDGISSTMRAYPHNDGVGSLGMEVGGTYTFSCEVYVPSAAGVALADVRLVIEHDDTVGSPVVSTSGNPSSFDTWHRLQVTHTINNDADNYATAYVDVLNPSGTDTIRIRKARFEEGSTVDALQYPFRPQFIASAYNRIVTWAQTNVGVGGLPGVSGLFRMADDIAEVELGDFTCDLYTSEFSPDLDRDKLWSDLRVVTRYGDVELAYSIDGGDTFTSLASSATETVGTYVYTDFDLTGVDVSKMIQFRFTVTRDEIGTFTEIVAHTLRFAFVGGEKRAWGMTVLGVDKPELLNSTSPLFDYATARSQLQTWMQSGTVLEFKDLHGDTYTVKVQDVQVQNPFIGAPDDDGNREGYFTVTLLEL